MANPNPTLPPPGRGRPKGSKNALPSPAKMREYRRSLRGHADAGDVVALGFITLIDALEGGGGEERQRSGRTPCAKNGEAP